MEREPPDPLAVPEFLRRPITPESQKRVAAVLKADVQRDWQMPDISKYRGGDEMSKEPVKIETQNPDFPVAMELTKGDGTKEPMNFDNLASFQEWFNPKLHELTGSAAGDDSTMITVSEKAADPAKKGAKAKTATKKAATKKAAAKKKAAAPVDRGAVVKSAGGGRGGSRAGVPRHGCKVGGVEYKSVWDAFQKLRLGDASTCVKFRNQLKASKDGKGTFTDKDGGKHNFTLVEKK